MSGRLQRRASLLAGQVDSTDLKLREHLRAIPRTFLFIRYSIEKMFNSSGYDPDNSLVDLYVETGTHSVSFARAGLPVGKDRRVVAVQRAFHQTAHACFVNRALIRLGIEHVVVRKGLVGSEKHLRLPLRYLSTNPAHIDHFASYLRPYSATDNQ